MADPQKNLIGKKKIVVDESAFLNLYRHPDGYNEQSSHLAPNHARAEVFGGIYIPVSEKVDKIRAYLGKSWDHRTKQPPATANSPQGASLAMANENPKEKIFSNNWGALNVFHKNPLEIDFCGEDPVDLPSDGSNIWAQGTGTERKIILKCNVGFADKVNPSFYDWLYFMKTGLIAENGAQYAPVVPPDTTWHFDHYHETHLPFTPKELATKQPIGKAYFADFNTFYNERIKSNLFEDATGLRNDIQNSMPSPYAFLKLLDNKSLAVNEFFDVKNLLQFIVPYYFAVAGATLSETHADVYSKLLKQYPLETLATLYGAIGTEIDAASSISTSKLIEKIITLDYKKHDADGLFEDYINAYTEYITGDDTAPKFANNDHFLARIRALENKFRTLIFSPHIIPVMSKVEKYKNHFPFGVNINFNAKVFTSLGDTMKTLFMTKLLSHIISSRFSRFPADPDLLFKTDTSGVGIGAYSGGNATTLSMIDYTQENVYKDISPVGTELEYSISPYRSDAFEKNVVDLETALNVWYSADSFYGSYVTGLSTDDIRSYTTFFRDDTNEPVNLDDEENQVWKTLFGSMFIAKINDIYNTKRRSYEDILNGKPAYTEDLFYRIQKDRKLPDGEWETVQNVLIPNTSDLDLVNYVDTQMKYHTYATYKYTVYTERVVFGSAYRYYWTDPVTDNIISGADIPPSKPFTLTPGSLLAGGPSEEDMQELQKGLTKVENLNDPNDTGDPVVSVPPLAGGGGDIPADFEIDPGTETSINEAIVQDVDFHATLKVRVFPSIKIIEDKLFETPEVFIMDKPPVPPDVNIIPYRAVNNRVKMLITSNVDRYRDNPIFILPEDEANFTKVKLAQLSFDEKVEFSSDDPVKTFQIFRVEQKPEKYKDFESGLYRQIDSFVFEENILPNTKYYYTFRSIDIHDHVSNPTPVYEVELIDEKGAVKPVIRTISMEVKENKTNIKECQKYIYLKPSLKQIYFSEDPEVDGIFSQANKKKKYKMRLTSKGSGKKIDINFSFRKTETV